MIRRHGIYRRAAFLSVVYSDNFSTGVMENTRDTYGYHSPAQVQFVFGVEEGHGERWSYWKGYVHNATAKRD